MQMVGGSWHYIKLKVSRELLFLPMRLLGGWKNTSTTSTGKLKQHKEVSNGTDSIFHSSSNRNADCVGE